MSALEYAKYWRSKLVDRQAMAYKMFNDVTINITTRSHWYGESIMLATQIENIDYLILLMEKECTQQKSSWIAT